MRTVQAISLLAILLAAEAGAADSIVLGRVLSSNHADDVEVPCPEDAICMHSWWRWTIDVRKTVNGPAVQGKVVSARMQHADMIRSYQKRQRLFVLKPIENAEQRRILKAEFYLEDMSPAHEMFCLWREPVELGLGDDVYVNGKGEGKRYCFSLPEEP